MGLGSGIRKKPIPDPESRGQKGTGSRIRIHNTVSLVLPMFHLLTNRFPYESTVAGSTKNYTIF
jgi:hypothetical protein